jgi:hypothetical protein
VIAGSNLNIKCNMKAGPGVVFIEGRDYKDAGPNYSEFQN